jgi:hypothetical protein
VNVPQQQRQDLRNSEAAHSSRAVTGPNSASNNETTEVAVAQLVTLLLLPTVAQLTAQLVLLQNRSMFEMRSYGSFGHYLSYIINISTFSDIWILCVS